MRRALALVVLLLVAGCGSSSPPAGHSQDWPAFRGDLFRDGHPPRATLTAAQLKHFKQRWTNALPGAVDGTPVVSGGVVYVGSYGGRFAAFRLDDGSQVWSLEGLGAISSSAAVSGSTVVVGTLTGHVLAFATSDGHKLWDYAAPGIKPAIWSSPAIYRRTVVIGVASQYGDNPLDVGRVIALDLLTGKEHWDFCVRAGCAAGSGVWSTAAIDDGGHGYIGVGNPDDAVIAFDVGSGQRLWSTTIYPAGRADFDVGATPAIIQIGTRELIADGSTAGLFALLNAGTGKAVWIRQIVQGGAVHGLIASPAYDGKTIYAGSASTPTDLFALNPLEGTTLWHRGLGKPIYSAPALGNGVVVFGTGDQPIGKGGGVYALSSTDGTLLWGFDDQYAVLGGPAIAGSVVIVGDTGGSVMAFST